MSKDRIKWKLIHKETGLTYDQWAAKHTPLDTSFAVLLENGTPAIYFNEKYYPWIQFLSLSEWTAKFKDQNLIWDKLMDKFLNNVLSLPNNISHKRRLKLIKKECQREYEFWRTTLFSGLSSTRDERVACAIAIDYAERFVIAKNTYHLGIFIRDFYRFDFLLRQTGFRISTLMKLGRVAQRNNKHIPFVYTTTTNYNSYPECDYNWHIIRQHNMPDMRKLKFTDTTNQYNETINDFARSVNRMGIDFDIAPYIFSPAKYEG